MRRNSCSAPPPPWRARTFRARRSPVVQTTPRGCFNICVPPTSRAVFSILPLIARWSRHAGTSFSEEFFEMGLSGLLRTGIALACLAREPPTRGLRAIPYGAAMSSISVRRESSLVKRRLYRRRRRKGSGAGGGRPFCVHNRIEMHAGPRPAIQPDAPGGTPRLVHTDINLLQ